MSKLCQRLWRDEDGFIFAEAMTLWAVTALGLVAGVVTVRDAVVAELTEAADTILTLDVSFADAAMDLFDNDSVDEAATDSSDTQVDTGGNASSGDSFYDTTASEVGVSENIAIDVP